MPIVSAARQSGNRKPSPRWAVVVPLLLLLAALPALAPRPLDLKLAPGWRAIVYREPTPEAWAWIDRGHLIGSGLPLVDNSDAGRNWWLRVGEWHYGLCHSERSR